MKEVKLPVEADLCRLIDWRQALLCLPLPQFLHHLAFFPYYSRESYFEDSFAEPESRRRRRSWRRSTQNSIIKNKTRIKKLKPKTAFHWCQMGLFFGPDFVLGSWKKKNQAAFSFSFLIIFIGYPPLDQ